MKNTISQFTLKELETIAFRALQESFSKIMSELLTELDQFIADHRDKQRFALKDKRKSDIMVALMDGQDLITTRGKFKRALLTDKIEQNDKPPKHFIERLTNH